MRSIRGLNLLPHQLPQFITIVTGYNDYVRTISVVRCWRICELSFASDCGTLRLHDLDKIVLLGFSSNAYMQSLII